jgi:hypothetical protein
MRPCEPTRDVSFHLTPVSDNLFPDPHELSNRPAVIFRGVGPAAIIRTDADAPGLPAAPHRLSRRGRRGDGPPADCE